MEEEGIDYESDPEEAKMSLKMRRREASDDEGEAENIEKPPRRVDESDEESEGAPADYEDDLEGGEEEEDYELGEAYVEEIDEEERVMYGESGGVGVEDGAVERDEGGKDGGVMEVLLEEKKVVSNDAREVDDESNYMEDKRHAKEKKELEPYAVPTAGAFYMHDDRLRDNAGGRHRRTLGGRKLWESKDDQKWGHDKFEELAMQERSNEERIRRSAGRYRGRGRNRGSERGYARRDRAREHTNGNNRDDAPKAVRGRGPRRYQPSFKNNSEAPLSRNIRPGKSAENPSVRTRESVSENPSVRTRESVSSVEPEVSLPRKLVIASSLNIASPPFYPSGSSTKDSSIPQPFKKAVQPGSINGNGQQTVVAQSFNMSQSFRMLREKNMVDSIDLDQLYIENPLSGMAGKPGHTMQIPLSGSSAIKTTEQQMRGQGKGITSLTQMTYKPTVSSSQVDKVPPPGQLQTVQRNPVQSLAQSSGWQFTQPVCSASRSSSPPNAAGAVNEVEYGDMESSSESSKSKTALVAKGKGSGRGSFLYGGAQVMGSSGNMGSGHGDQNFPAFLPVMQFGGQHPGGIGVPAVGMAFPGYVAQQQHGLGSSEMTWLPVLAGAAGALGATYCPPYIAVDGSYHAHPSGQKSSTASLSSKENYAMNIGSDLKPAQNPEVANDDLVQRQKNPRRYTEMKFDQ